MCLSCLGFVVLRIGLLCSFVEIDGAVEHFAMVGAVWADPEFPLQPSLDRSQASSSTAARKFS